VAVNSHAVTFAPMTGKRSGPSSWAQRVPHRSRQKQRRAKRLVVFMPGIKDASIRERNSQRIFGCSEAVALSLNDGKRLRDPSSLAMKYCIQRQAAAKRKIAWEITFPEWLEVWQRSGLLAHRGVGRAGYCMARHGDEGPYRVGNVSIKSSVENSREGISKTIRLRKGKPNGGINPALGKGRGWTKRAKGALPYQVVVGSKYVGVFATEAEARSAYLAACEVHKSPRLLTA